MAIINGNVTHVKSKNGNIYKFFDKGAIRTIRYEAGTPTSEDLIPDAEGTVKLQFQTIQKATNSTIGLVRIPLKITYDGENIDNGIKVNTEGELSVKFPITNIRDSSGIFYEPKNGTIILPQINTEKLGLSKIKQRFNIKQEEGYLYTEFSNGWNDIDKETKKIDFKVLVENNKLSFEEYA